MGQNALETALIDLTHVFLWPFFFAGQIIYDIGGLRRIFVCWSYKGNPSWLLKSHFKEA